MRIQIEPRALAYIQDKSPEKVVTLNVLERPAGSCSNCGGLRYPSVKIGSPTFLEDYEKINIEDTTVYYRPALCDMYSGITIKLDKLFFVAKSLVAVGDK